MPAAPIHSLPRPPLLGHSVLAVLEPEELAAAHQVIEDELTRAQPDAEKARCLFQVQAEPRHLPEGSGDLLDELFAGWLIP
jgi:hypothetical protein